MSKVYWMNIVVVSVLASSICELRGQVPTPRAEGATDPVEELPKPVKEAPSPVTPKPIHVGSGPAQAYIGPMPYWRLMFKRTLSDADVLDLEKQLSENPEDTCSRGQLIASSYTRPEHRRTLSKHMLWMIHHRPDWEGFLLDPPAAFAERLRDQPVVYEELRQAWRSHIGPQQKHALILHNAAVFFAIREPILAESLLKRAIQLESTVPLHEERLGAV
jgi:hypothetical protein